MKNTINLTKYMEHLPDDQKNALETELSTTEILPDNTPILRKTITINKNFGEQDENTSSGYISTSDMDHSGDIVVASGIDLSVYMKNPVVLYNHDRNQVIAKCVDLTVDSKGALATWEWAPTAFAQEIKTLVKGGYISTLSIGFVPLKVLTRRDREFGSYETPNATRIIEKYLLLEFSCVTIPDNPNALITNKDIDNLHISKETAAKVGLKIEKEEKEDKEEKQDKHVEIDRTIVLVKSAQEVKKEKDIKRQNLIEKKVNDIVAKKMGKIIIV